MIQYDATLIIRNSNDEILLQLRDNKPEIPFPNHWTLPGGKMEEGENSKRTLRREMLEEIDVKIDDHKFFRAYQGGERVDSVYWVERDLDLNKINSFEDKEGQEFRYFPREQIRQMKLAYNDNDIVEDFYVAG
jgi:8-oxo-dGTP diphosphatase